jgi:nitric oxide reductase activation protein
MTLFDRKRRHEAQHRAQEAARKRQERERKDEREREEDERLLRSYALADKVMRVAVSIGPTRSFERACKRSGIDPDDVRDLLTNGTTDPYVAAELESLRSTCRRLGVDWRRR